MSMLATWHDVLFWPRRINGDVVEASLRAYPLLGTAGTVAALIVLFVLAVAIARPRGGQLTWRRRAVLTTLRIVAALCLVPGLLELSMQLRVRRSVPPVLAIALDTSQSMTLEDRYIDEAAREQLREATGVRSDGVDELPDRLSRVELARRMLTATAGDDVSRIDRLGRSAEVNLFTINTSATPLAAKAELAASEPLGADGESTSLSQSIDEIVSLLRGRPSAGVLLLSDGGHNTGASPLAACADWREAGMSVHAVTVGDPAPKDIEVRQILANELLFQSDPATVNVRLRQRGYGSHPVTIILSHGDEELARSEVSFPEGVTEQHATLTFTPHQSGELVFTVHTPIRPDEMTADNNEKHFRARVTAEKIRVLYIEDEPRWQYRFLRDAMTRDRRLRVHIFLAGGQRADQPTEQFLNRLPAGRSEWEAYDLVILGDVDPGLMTSEDIDTISGLVREDGIGLMLLAGPRYNPFAYGDTTLGELFPVEIPSTAGVQGRPRAEDRARFRPEMTPLGQTHPAIQLADEPVENVERWETLPEIYWFAAVGKARGGATVLAVHPSERYRGGTAEEPVPLIAMQQVGRGRCIYCGFDETWRWRFRQGDRIFYRFWGQIVQYLGAPHLAEDQPVQMWADQAVYNRGQTALITVRAEALSGSDAPVVVDEAPDGGVRRHELAPSAGAQHVFEARVPLDVAGRHRIWLDGAGLQASVSVDVETARIEFENPAANVDLMRQIAESTGGASGRAHEIDRVIDQIDLSPRTIETQETRALWDRPLLALLFVGFLGTEWILRRLWQLP